MIAIYPRGFLGMSLKDSEDESTNDDLQEVVKSIKLNLPLPKGDDVYKPNEEVEDLYESHRLGNFTMNNAEFREQVLLTCMKAFGTDSFYDWCKLQERSPYFGNTHARFINDTLKYIDTGKRSVSVESWNSIIRREDKASGGGININFKDFFRMGQSIEFRRDERITSVVASWMTYPNSFNDLLTTCHILFGKM